MRGPQAHEYEDQEDGRHCRKCGYFISYKDYALSGRSGRGRMPKCKPVAVPAPIPGFTVMCTVDGCNINGQCVRTGAVCAALLIRKGAQK